MRRKENEPKRPLKFRLNQSRIKAIVSLRSEQIREITPNESQLNSDFDGSISVS